MYYNKEFKNVKDSYNLLVHKHELWRYSKVSHITNERFRMAFIFKSPTFIWFIVAANAVLSVFLKQFRNWSFTRRG